MRTTRTDLQRLEREQIVVSTQLAAAAEIQRRLLPSQPRMVNGIACAVGFESAWEIGGDFYDFLPIAHDAMLVVIGDISGKGIPAAILLAFVRTALRVAAARTSDPAELLTELSGALYEDNEGTPYATCLVSRVDTQRGTLTYANAGHPPGVIFGAHGLQVLDHGGPPVGMFESPRYVTEMVAYHPGDLAVVVTDGITEKDSQDRPPDELLASLVDQVPPPRAPGTVCDAIMAFARQAEGPPRHRRLVGRSHRPGFPVVGSISRTWRRRWSLSPDRIALAHPLARAALTRLLRRQLYVGRKVRLEARLGEGTAEWTAALGQLADSHYYAGHYDVADGLNGRVLASTRAIYGAQHPRVADILINLGASQSDRGKYAEAERFYRPALDILRAHYGADHFRTASAETMLGRTLVYEKRFDDGVPLLEHALSVQERVNGPVHPRVASALNDLEAAALQQKRLDEAAARFSRMIEIYRSVYGGDHYLLATATSNLGSVFVETGDFARAERLYREAVAMFTRVQSPTHLNTGIARLKLGRSLLRQKRYADAEEHSRAGYDIVRAQANPSIGFLTVARTDLIAEYEALGKPEQAASIRAELQAASAATRNR